MILAGILPFVPVILAWFYMPKSQWTFIDDAEEARNFRKSLEADLREVE